jgi:bacteriocin-like protein
MAEERLQPEEEIQDDIQKPLAEEDLEQISGGTETREKKLG